MALILGTNTYISLDAFKAWCSLRYYDYTQFTDQKISGVIVQTCLDFIETQYDFLGDKLDESQPMQLPSDELGISEIENPVALAVWYNLNGWLLVDPSTVNAGGQIIMERKKLDTMEKEVEYAEGKNSTYTLNIQAVNNAFAPFVEGGYGDFNRVIM